MDFGAPFWLKVDIRLPRSPKVIFYFCPVSLDVSAMKQRSDIGNQITIQHRQFLTKTLYEANNSGKRTAVTKDETSI